MADAALESALAAGSCDVGQVRIISDDKGYLLCHREDVGRRDLRVQSHADAAGDLARVDDSGKYRPLKTAPSLRHGWALRLTTIGEVARALDAFYPGRLAMLAAFNAGRVEQTPLRQTLNRQTGMYRAAANISDDQIERVVHDICRSDGGCLRAILWKKNELGDVPSQSLPARKFDVRENQAEPARLDGEAGAFVPLLCPEACAVLIDACRKVVRAEESSRVT